MFFHIHDATYVCPYYISVCDLTTTNVKAKGQETLHCDRLFFFFMGEQLGGRAPLCVRVLSAGRSI